MLCVCSDAASDADNAADGSEVAASPTSAHQPAVTPTYTCRKATGQLGGYSATAAATSDQSHTRKTRSRWQAPVQDVVPCAKPMAAFPAVAVPVEPSAPLMTVPEEHSFICADGQSL